MLLQGHTWTAKISIYSPELSPTANLAGTTTVTFDPVTGLAMFNDLSLDVRGRYALQATVTSNPTQHSLTARSKVIEIKIGKCAM